VVAGVERVGAPGVVGYGAEKRGGERGQRGLAGARGELQAALEMGRERAEQGVHGCFDSTRGPVEWFCSSTLPRRAAEIEERGIRPRRVEEGAGECRIAHARADRPSHGFGTTRLAAGHVPRARRPRASRSRDVPLAIPARRASGNVSNPASPAGHGGSLRAKRSRSVRHCTPHA